MSVESTIRAGVGFVIPTVATNMSGALSTATSPTYSFYTGGAGAFRTCNGANPSGSYYTLTVPGASVPAENGVVLFTAASGIVAQQFQVFPDGPIKNAVQRVWFCKILSSTGLVDGSGTAPTCEWLVPGSSAVSVTPVAGAHAGFWYVELTAGQTNTDSGVLRVTGTGLIPLSIPIFFATAAAAGGGGGGFLGGIGIRI